MKLICSVCSSTINEDQRYAATPCGCVFHEECVTPYVEQHHRCPKCGAPTQDTLPLYFSYNNVNTDNKSVEVKERYDRICQQIIDENIQYHERYFTEFQSHTDLKLQLDDREKLFNNANCRISSLKQEYAKNLQKMELLQNCEGKHLKTPETTANIEIEVVQEDRRAGSSHQVIDLTDESPELPDNRKLLKTPETTANIEIEVIDLTDESPELPDNRKKDDHPL